MTIPKIDGVERRILDVDLEYRADDDGKAPTVRGYAAVFGRESQPLGGMFGKFVEVIERGAFADAIRESGSVPLLIEHEGLALADTATKTLTLEEDTKGLRFEALLDPEDPDAQRVLPKLKRGTLRKMSFGFVLGIKGDEWKEDSKSGVVTRTIKKIARLFDVSLVTNPAYPDTSAALRSLEAWQREQPAGAPTVISTPVLNLARKRLLLTAK